MRFHLAALALALAGCAAEGPAPRAAIPRVNGPEQLAERLPEDAAGFRRGANAPVSTPAPGREVAYATANRAAAAFVQVLAPTGEPLPDGPSSPAAQAEYARWRDETAGGGTASRRLRLVSEGDRGPLLRCAEFEGSYGRQPVQSLICVGAAAGQMLRLRVSMPRRDTPVADREAFIAAITAALR